MGHPPDPWALVFWMKCPDLPIFYLSIHIFWPNSPLTLCGLVPAGPKAGVLVAINA